MVATRNIIKEQLFLHEKKELEDLAQNAKIKWCIEGDENSKFFHGVLNRKRSQVAIKGVKVDGDWVTEPGAVKEVFLSYFRDKFKHFQAAGVRQPSANYRQLSSETVARVGRPVSREEIRSAVWACSS